MQLKQISKQGCIVDSRNNSICPLFAKYPYNEMREPSRPFCLFCGELGEADSQVCKKCGGELWKKI